MNRRPFALAAATSATALASAVLPGAAASAEAPALDPLEAALEQAFTAHPAPVGPTDTVAIDSVDGTASVELNGGGVAEIKLPFADSERATTTVDAHSATFRDEASDTTAVVQPLVTNGVRMILTMGGAESPSRYEFDLGDSSGIVELSLAPNGGVQVSDSLGGDLGFIAAPWAMDANGDPIPTYYEIDGNRLVQVVDHEGAVYPVVADPSFQGDCGYVTCTLRFNRARTRDARDAAWIIGAVGGACAVVSAGTLAIVCGAAVAPAAVVLAVAAGRYYEDGDCLKIKFSIAGGLAWPGRVDHGDYNCTDK